MLGSGLGALDEDDDEDEEYHTVGPGVPVAPKATSKAAGGGFSFGLMGGDSSSSSDPKEPSI